MISRPAVPLPDAASLLARATPAAPRIDRSRLLRRGSAIVLVSVGAYAMLADANHVVSDNAVISAQLISLRSPVDGVVEASFGKVGEAVAVGTQLAVIENPLVDDRPRVIAQQTLNRLRAERAAGMEERTTLTALLADLNGRAERYRQAITSRLELQTGNTGRLLAGKQAELAQARRDLRRKQALAGTIAQAEIEKAQTAVDIAEQEAEALGKVLASAEGTTRWAAGGILVEPGQTADVAYSAQRADEVRLRLAAAARSVAQLTAAVEEAEARLAIETQVFTRTRAASVQAPNDGTIWRIGAARGERLAAGDLVAQLVDCRAEFLAVAVPQNRLPDIEWGGAATFRLAGEDTERTGRVRTMTGESAMQSESRLAAAPMAGTRPTALVLVDVPGGSAKAGGCLVGRTAHVVLPASGVSWLGKAMRWLPGPGTFASLLNVANDLTSH